MNRILKNLVYHAPWLFGDRRYLELRWRLKTGRRLNLDNPLTFNEKIQWLKLYDRKPEYHTMVDKAAVKDYVAGIIGAEHVIPTIGVFDRVKNIPWDTLPPRFVLKCTHDSGGIVICRDKAALDIPEACRKLSAALRTNFWFRDREWVYKGLKPRIICEELMEDSAEGCSPTDYKFFCCDGLPKFMFIATDRGIADKETKFDFFDMDFGHLPFTNGHPNAGLTPSKPSCWDEMIDIASKLSRGLRHVRVDLYQIDGKVYFGEMTFYHWGGFVPFDPPEWDRKLGDLIQL